MSNETYLVEKKQCPKCKSLGKDNSKDNLAVYSDSHEWCFSCGFYKKGNKIKQLQQLPKKELEIVLPYDCTFDYPQEPLKWIEQYELSRNDLLAHHVMWSDWASRLYFPIFDATGLLAYQGRYFGTEKKPKWWGQGDLKNVHHYLLTPNPDDSIILCEDIVSAIKIQKVGYNSMPLFGSHIDFKRLSRLSKRFSKVGIYLDPDKRKEAVKFAQLGKSLGLDCYVIFSDKDPKEESMIDLERILK